MGKRAARLSGPGWRPWTIWLAGSLAIGAACFFVFASLAALIMGSWDTPSPGLPWIRIGIAGQCVLGAAGIGLLVLGLASPSRRRSAVLAASAVVVAEVAWFVLIGRLVSAAS